MTNAQTAFQTAHLFACKRNEVVERASQAVLSCLKQFSITVSADAETCQILGKDQLHLISDKPLHQANLIIAVGGDGTILRAAQYALEYDIPLLGVNCGRIGFLGDIDSQTLSQLEAVLGGDYHLEFRLVLSCKTISNTEEQDIGYAINEVSLRRGEAIRMLEFDININHQFICNQRADGLVIATPTGSTAYALSAGGPIVQPDLSAITLVPMCPHTLNTRPIVISPDNHIQLNVNAQHTPAPQISCDGQRNTYLTDNMCVVIHAASKKLQLIHPPQYHYFTTLKNKLHWERKPYAKPSGN